MVDLNQNEHVVLPPQIFLFVEHKDVRQEVGELNLPFHSDSLGKTFQFENILASQPAGSTLKSSIIDFLSLCYFPKWSYLQ